MVKVAFVGNKPSHDNVHHDIPFVGSKAFDTLLIWIKFLKPDYYEVLNREDCLNQDRVAALYDEGFDIIALGKEASLAIHAAGIPHYRLPHPSSKSRVLTNKPALAKRLAGALAYIQKGSSDDID